MCIHVVRMGRGCAVITLFCKIIPISLILFAPPPPLYPLMMVIRCINQIQDQDRPLSTVSRLDFTVSWFVTTHFEKLRTLKKIFKVR